MASKSVFFFTILAFAFFSFEACDSKPKRLPILGEREIVNGDTIFHEVPDMVLIDQDSQAFQLSKLGNKVVVADFFFTS
ncbi:MAG TPA: hypothetical protein VN763_13410, partial [Saprospiraceae bacterium]|nr:hypothetical protein [Saprospiraceae bacterium]